MRDTAQVMRLRVGASKSAELDVALEGITNGVNRATAGAINRTLAKGKTAAKRGMTKYLATKPKALDKRFFVKKATPSRLYGSLNIMGRKMGLIKFKTKDTRSHKGWGNVNSGKGVVVEVVRGQPFTLPHAFIATGKVRGTAVFQRTSKDRNKITNTFSRDLYALYKQSPLAESVPAGMEADLSKQIDSQINRLLAGR